MRVLHLDSGREMRGGQWQALYLIQEQRRAGLQPLLLARKSGALYSTALEEGVQTAALSWLALRRVSRECDVAHCHDARSHGYAAVGAQCPFVVSRRVAFPVRPGAVSRWKYRRAAHYIAVSRFVAGELLSAGVPNSSIAVIHDAIPFPEKPSTRSRGMIAVDVDDPLKGRSLTAAAATQAGITVEYTRDLPEALETASALVYISESEGLGSAVLLAMAYRVPVIASCVGGLPEIVRDGETGLLVANDAVSIAAAMRRVVEEPEFAERLASQARSYVVQKHSFAALETATRAVYQGVIGHD